MTVCDVEDKPMSGNEQRETDNMIPIVNARRVCLSCWSRLPGVYRLSNCVLSPCIQATRSICSPVCGQRWTRVMSASTSSYRTYCTKSEQKTGDTPCLEDNPYFAKYKDKLKKKESESPEEFKARVDELKQVEQERHRKRKEDLTSPPEEVKNSSLSQSVDLPSSWPPKSLDDVMKVDLIKDKSPEEIDRIWKEYHLQKDCVFAVIKAADYDDVIQKSKTCPLFIYPLPRGDGFEFIFAQFNGKDVYFTPLQMYQTHKENAPICLTVAHFPELKEEKGIVLMAGKYDDKILNKKEALSLVRQMSHYYGGRTKDRFTYVQCFNLKPQQFNHVDLISEYKEMEKSLNSEY